MSGENYENEWWGIVYDQWNEQGGRRRVHDQEFQFYRDHLARVESPILEAACGTGSILLRLAQLGHEMWGFDISEEMLSQLRQKAIERGLPEVNKHISQQSFVNFKYDQTFSAITIPAAAFMHIATQEDQIATLKNIHKHLKPNGQLLLNFFIPPFDYLKKHSDTPLIEEEFGTFKHPNSDLPIEVYHKTIVDLSEQTETIYWIFVHDSHRHEIPLYSRWIYKEEFLLLLQIAGFSSWQLYGSHDNAPYKGSSGLTKVYCIANK